MGEVFYKVTWTDEDSTSHDITDATIITQSDGLDVTSSQFTFKLDNTKGEYSFPNMEFHQGDTIDIYLDRTDATNKINFHWIRRGDCICR